MDVSGVISSCKPLDVLFNSCGGGRDWIPAIGECIVESEELARGEGMKRSWNKEDATW